MLELMEQIGLNRNSCAGQVIVVSGAGGGIGFQVARTFALLGGSVVIAEISDRGGEAAEKICAEGGQAIFFPTDVSDPASVNRLRDQVLEQFDRVDVLVNNAIKIVSAAVTEMDVADWDRVLAVNLRGAFLMSKAFLPDMLEHQHGVIVNMISTDAMPGLSAYISSKQGLLGFSQSLALELTGRGVFVVPFAPGMVDTPGIRSVSADLSQRLGMSEGQLLSLSLHPAYTGMMPAEHAGLATAYLGLRLAEEFNGQEVNGYEVLERAGLIDKAGVNFAGQTQKMDAPSSARAETRPTEDMGFDHTVALLGQLGDILRETEATINKLPVFVRPMAKSGFKKKSGQSLADWQRSVEELRQQLGNDQRMTAAEKDIWRGNLQQVMVYYREEPQEAARFSKDPVFLDEVEQISTKRLALIQALSAVLSQ
jgi:NAD(P)-dependent dehydrogenase (short-subunit alcohol dehydrogenase family)